MVYLTVKSISHSFAVTCMPQGSLVLRSSFRSIHCLIVPALPRLEKLVATIRSREISCCLVLQAQSQLKALYKDSADTIIGNMDCSIFLGGKEPGTLKELAAALGKETIDSYNTGESRGREVSHSLNYQKLGKDMPYLFVKSSVALNLS